MGKLPPCFYLMLYIWQALGWQLWDSQGVEDGASIDQDGFMWEGQGQMELDFGFEFSALGARRCNHWHLHNRRQSG